MRKDEEPPVILILPIAYIPYYQFNKMIDAIHRIEYSHCLVYIIAKVRDEDRANYYQLVDDHCRTKLVIQSHDTPGFKARALNTVLSDVKKRSFKYGIIIDGYHMVKPNIITEFVHAFQGYNSDVAYIQAGVDYTAANWIQYFGRTLRSHLYYFYIRARSQFGNAQFNGSTSCFRMSALYDIGGVPEYSYTENSSVSVQLQLAGYQGKFLNMSLSTCSARPSLGSTASQLNRWAHGLGAVVQRETRSILESSQLTLLQKLDIVWYHLSSSPASSLTLILPVVLSSRLLLAYVSPSFQGYLTLELLFLVGTTVMLLSFFWVGSLVILVEESRYSIKERYLHLFVFTLVTLSFSVFILGSYAKGRKNIDGPFSRKASWNSDVNISKRKAILLLIYLLGLLSLLSISIHGLMAFLPITLLFILSNLTVFRMK